jgi:hypothetical protein
MLIALHWLRDNEDGRRVIGTAPERMLEDAAER